MKKPVLKDAQTEVEKQQRELLAWCRGLMRAYKHKMKFPSDDKRRNGPITPNDPATIYSLASYLAFYINVVGQHLLKQVYGQIRTGGDK